jgi:DNA-nicking Smr family endonuclease
MNGGRKLSREDLALWNRVLQSVTPYHPDRPAADPEHLIETDAPQTPSAEHAKPGATAKSVMATAAPYFPPVSGSKAKQAPALAPLELRQKKRLARGQAEIDGRLDLHGMRQSTAFHTLIGFLRQAQARQMRTVLVITGKGSAVSAEDGRGGSQDSERGILRRIVPQWLSRSEFRDLVVGFDAASRRHGGDGALYIRIRRNK